MRMKLLGIALVAIGLGALVYQWMNKEELVKKAEANAQPTLAWPMYVGALSTAAGTFILMGKKKTT